LPNADPAPAVRAQRDAVNPLRMIIEAGKLKARPKPATEARAATEAEPPAKRVRIAAGKVPDGSPEASSDPVAVARPAAPQPAAPSPAQGDGAVQATAPAGPASVEAEPAVATLLPVVATRADSDAALDPRRAALAAVTPAPSRAARSPLVLADYVEPVVPERVRNRLRGAPEVVLDLLVRADGSVGEATVRSSTDKALEPLALAAVRQWRYKPIAQDQPHAVQLVFPQ
jgi:TonB family protein